MNQFCVTQGICLMKYTKIWFVKIYFSCLLIYFSFRSLCQAPQTWTASFAECWGPYSCLGSFAESLWWERWRFNERANVFSSWISTKFLSGQSTESSFTTQPFGFVFKSRGKDFIKKNLDYCFVAYPFI